MHPSQPDHQVFKGSGGFADELVAERERRESASASGTADDELADDESDDEGGFDGTEVGCTQRTDSTIDEVLTFGKIYVIGGLLAFDGFFERPAFLNHVFLNVFSSSFLS